MLDRRVLRGQAQVGSDASGLLETRALQKHIENHQKLLESLRQEVRCVHRRTLGADLTAPSALAPKQVQDGQCANDPWNPKKSKARLPALH